MDHDGERRGLATVWPGLLLVVLGAAGFLLLADSVAGGDGLSRVDEPVLGWMVGHRHPAVTAVLTVITVVFGPVVLPVLTLAGCLVWGYLRRRWWEPALLAGAMLFAVGVSSLSKVLYGRARPPDEAMTVPHETSFSFPSGHTIGAATLVLVAGYLLWSHAATRRARIWGSVGGAVVVLLVAASRLYLGYHFVTDVLAGASLATAVLGVVVVVDRQFGSAPRPPG